MSIATNFYTDVNSEPGTTLRLPVRQTANGTKGDYWNETTKAFQTSAPADADMPPLTEGRSGEYTFQTATLETYTGQVTIGPAYEEGDTTFEPMTGSATLDVQGGKRVIYANTNQNQQTPGGNTVGGQLDKAGTGGGGGTVSPVVVDESLTWEAYQTDAGSIARQVVSVTEQFKGTLAFAFADIIAGSTIDVVLGVNDDQGTTFTNQLRAIDGTTAHFDFDAPTPAGTSQTHIVNVKIRTVDGQERERQGVLRVLKSS